MQGDGIDRARALLEPFRFGFPRIMVALYTFAAKSSRDVSESVDAALVESASKVFPVGTTIVRNGWDTISIWNERPESHGLLKVTSEELRSHIKLLETAAIYAG